MQLCHHSLSALAGLHDACVQSDQNTGLQDDGKRDDRNGDDEQVFHRSTISTLSLLGAFAEGLASGLVSSLELLLLLIQRLFATRAPLIYLLASSLSAGCEVVAAVVGCVEDRLPGLAPGTRSVEHASQSTQA